MSKRVLFTEEEVNRLCKLVVKFRSLDDKTMVATIASLMGRSTSSIWGKITEISFRAD